ncbi:glycosyltransferase [Sphingomonas sp. CJ20]
MPNPTLEGFRVFALGVPLEIRPAIEAQFSKAVINFITVQRPISDFHARISANQKRAIITWDEPTAPILEYAKNTDTPIYRANENRSKRSNNIVGLDLLDPDLALMAFAKPEPALPTEDADFSDIVDRIKLVNNAHPTANLPFRGSDAVTPEDITVVFGVRLHALNPWIVDRIEFFSNYYNPLPKVVVVDFGSELEYSEKIEAACQKGGFVYHYVDDRGIFSLSSARNAGFEVSDTPLVFFNDPDFFFPSDFFADLSKKASELSAVTNIDVVLMCPAYHLTEKSTQTFSAMPDNREKSSFLRQIAYTSIYSEFGNDFEFIAPYSNVFLINRTLYSLCGGYDSRFRGHGSEDFEFFCRLSAFAGGIPTPPKVMSDMGGPLKAEFFNVKKYEGFRALNTVICLPAEMEGLKAFHLYHPTPKNDSWRENNDWKRDRLRETMGAYETEKHKVLNVDSLSRTKRVLCVCLHKDHWGYFAPLRILGYELVPMFDDSVAEIEEATRKIQFGEVDAFAIFNPYMTSYMKVRGLYYLARKTVKMIIVERGALPNTIYYAGDVAYAETEYTSREFEAFLPSENDLARAGHYMNDLTAGSSTLERNHSYAFTSRKYSPLRSSDRQICFVPLQLDDDMAVTMFVRDAQRYPDFVMSIERVAAENPDIIFLVKPHPLSKLNTAFKSPNIILAEREDNIHCLIDLSTFVVCYNSGVGLLALAHGKTVISVGNAYFFHGDTGRFSDSFEAAISDYISGKAKPPEPSHTRRLFSWLLDKKYSFFSAEDDVREFDTRKAHSYKNIIVSKIRLDDESANLGRLSASNRFSPKSFGFALLNYGATAEQKK